MENPVRPSDRINQIMVELGYSGGTLTYLIPAIIKYLDETFDQSRKGE